MSVLSSSLYQYGTKAIGSLLPVGVGSLGLYVFKSVARSHPALTITGCLLNVILLPAIHIKKAMSKIDVSNIDDGLLHYSITVISPIIWGIAKAVASFVWNFSHVHLAIISTDSFRNHLGAPMGSFIGAGIAGFLSGDQFASGFYKDRFHFTLRVGGSLLASDLGLLFSNQSSSFMGILAPAAGALGGGAMILSGKFSRHLGHSEALGQNAMLGGLLFSYSFSLFSQVASHKDAASSNGLIVVQDDAG